MYFLVSFHISLSSAHHITHSPIISASCLRRQSVYMVSSNSVSRGRPGSLYSQARKEHLCIRRHSPWAWLPVKQFIFWERRCLDPLHTLSPIHIQTVLSLLTDKQESNWLEKLSNRATNYLQYPSLTIYLPPVGTLYELNYLRNYYLWKWN